MGEIVSGCLQFPVSVSGLIWSSVFGVTVGCVEVFVLNLVLGLGFPSVVGCVCFVLGFFFLEGDGCFGSVVFNVVFFSGALFFCVSDSF